MASVRLTVTPNGDLVANSGKIVGRLLALEVELPVACGGEEGIRPSSLPTASVPEQQALRLDVDASEFSTDASLETPAAGGRASNKVTTKDDAERVNLAWKHYQGVVPGGNRFVLDEKKKRIIRDALATADRLEKGRADSARRSLVLICRAIDGLAASPHHNGENDRRKKYLGIQYALAGRGNESTDERLRKMSALAKSTIPDYIDTLPSAGREMVRDHMNKVAASLLAPQDDNLRARAEGSETYLRSTFGLVPNVVDGKVEWSRVSPT